MTRWNIVEIAFYGMNGHRRSIKFSKGNVTILTGRSGTGKSAIIAAIDYCLGSKSCELPDFVRQRALGVGVHWRNDGVDMIVGRVVPQSGTGTERMFVKTGRNLNLPFSFEKFEGPAPRATARTVIERAFGIADLDDGDADDKQTVGKATIRHVTPYLFLTADVIISNKTLLHDLNDPDKAKDIRATMPYFLKAVDQETILNQRKLRQLEAAYGRMERQESARKKGTSLLTERAMALLAQCAELGMTERNVTTLPEQRLIEILREVSTFDFTGSDGKTGDLLSTLENERRKAVQVAFETRQMRDTLRNLVKDSSGFETAASEQYQKLRLVDHLGLNADVCPVCNEKSDFGRTIAQEIARSLSLIEGEIASVQRVTPELLEQLELGEKNYKDANDRVREIEQQIRSVIQANEALKRVDSLAQARAITVGRVEQFLQTTVEDYHQKPINFDVIKSQMEDLRELVDPQALRDRISHAENMVSNYASEMMADLPTTAPLTDARLQFFADGRVRIIESERQRQLNLVEVGSDQNYLAIHLALLFALHKHFEQASSPVPGLLVIDQISRPYYPKEEKAIDERSVKEIADDDDRRSMAEIVDFIFKETAKASGLQVLLIEHAYMENDPRYVDSTIERWTKANGEKLIPDSWPVRE